MPHPDHKINSGFTLIELSVVMAIIGVILYGSMSLLVVGIQTSQFNSTVATMDAIEKALLNFRVAYGRIPCPADITATASSANYGVEAANTGTCTGGSPAANFIAASGTVEGGVPIRALRLPDSYMYDGWGHKFRYAVNPSYTTATVSPCSYSTSSGAITVNDASGAARSTAAIYAIVSHGANGHGAYTSNGIVVNAGSANADEKTNCHCDNTAAHTGGAGVLSPVTYVQKAPTIATAGSPLTAFDDIVTYKEAWQMMTPNLASNSFACSSYLWVADYGNNRILQLTMTGKFVQGYGAGYNGIGGLTGSSGSSDGKFNNPTSAILDSSGNIWVADTLNSRVQKLSANGQWLMTIGGTTSQTCSGTYASATTCTNLSGYSACCAPNAASCTCSSGSANGQFSVSGVPQQLAFDTSGNLWVTDYSNNRIQEFNSKTGAWIQSISTNNPSGLAISNGYIWVANPNNTSISQCTFGGSCTPYGSGDLAHGADSPSDYMAVDGSGNIWVSDQDNLRLDEFNSSGSFINHTATGEPEGIAVDGTGNIWYSNNGANTIVQMTIGGTVLQTISTISGTAPTGLSSPQSIFTSR